MYPAEYYNRDVLTAVSTHSLPMYLLIITCLEFKPETFIQSMGIDLFHYPHRAPPVLEMESMIQVQILPEVVSFI